MIRRNGNGEFILGKKTSISIGILFIIIGALFSIGCVYVKDVRAAERAQVTIENNADKITSLEENLVPRQEFNSAMLNVVSRLDRIDNKLDDLRGEPYGKREN